MADDGAQPPPTDSTGSSASNGSSGPSLSRTSSLRRALSNTISGTVNFVNTAIGRTRWADICDSDDDSTAGASMQKADSSSSGKLSRASSLVRAGSDIVAKLLSGATGGRWADIADSESERTPSGRLQDTPAGYGLTAANPEEDVTSCSAGSTAGSDDSLRQRRRSEEQQPTSFPNTNLGASSVSHIHSLGPTSSTPSAASMRCPPRYSAAGRGAGGGRGGGGARCSRRNRRIDTGSEKHQCQFIIGIDHEPSFNVKGRLIGRAGQNMKDIFQQAGEGTKTRIRGRGSGFLEGPRNQESSDPLMLCVSATSVPAYEKAKSMCIELLEGIYEEYRQKHPGSMVGIDLHEGPREGC